MTNNESYYERWKNVTVHELISRYASGLLTMDAVQLLLEYGPDGVRPIDTITLRHYYLDENLEKVNKYAKGVMELCQEEKQTVGHCQKNASTTVPILRKLVR